MQPGIVFGATSAMEIAMPFCYIGWNKMSKASNEKKKREPVLPLLF
jgi:predicted DsbA family dithiol-disulfide isomerase